MQWLPELDPIPEDSRNYQLELLQEKTVAETSKQKFNTLM